MISMTKYSGALAAAVSLACYAGATTAAGMDFAQALAQDYAALSQAEFTQGDERDGQTYAQRAQAAQQGTPTAPDQVELRQPFLKDKYISELSQSRTRLVTALDKTGRTDVPEVAARAQSSYDCWIEQASEDLQPEDINACKNSFMTAIAAVEAAATKVVTEEVVPPAAAVPAESYPEKFLVFFDFDRATVTSEGLAVVESANAAANGKPFKHIIATGHADKSGGDSYNMALSQRRANAVKSALGKQGLSADSIETAARGESEPLVPTDDGIREPQNRRVEIVIER